MEYLYEVYIKLGLRALPLFCSRSERTRNPNLTPFAKQMPNLNLMLNLKIASDVDVLVTKDGQTMAEMKTAH